MAYNQKPETPLVNNGEFGDKIEKATIKPAKKIDVENKEPELRTLPGVDEPIKGPELRTLPKEKRKWSEKKDEDSTVKQHGPKRIHNPDKIMGDGRTKEEWVRSGDRKDYNKEAAKSWGISLGGGSTAFWLGKLLGKR